MKEAGLTQPALAQALGTSQGTVSGWLGKEPVYPTGEHMVRLPGVLRVSGHWLMTGDGPVGVPGPRTVRESGTETRAAVYAARARIGGALDELERQLVGPTSGGGDDSHDELAGGALRRKQKADQDLRRHGGRRDDKPA